MSRKLCVLCEINFKRLVNEIMCIGSFLCVCVLFFSLTSDAKLNCWSWPLCYVFSAISKKQIMMKEYASRATTSNWNQHNYSRSTWIRKIHIKLSMFAMSNVQNSVMELRQRAVFHFKQSNQQHLNLHYNQNSGQSYIRLRNDCMRFQH